MGTDRTSDQLVRENVGEWFDLRTRDGLIVSGALVAIEETDRIVVLSGAVGETGFAEDVIKVPIVQIESVQQKATSMGAGKRTGIVVGLGLDMLALNWLIRYFSLGLR